ncbi:uncharacterized protein CLUP02_16487 [Colletotrichum lupini]|uniref:Uncharacterized protein n=1 Tax=Colletotrichum lupini TaxID=145971 RepID=A0A9Q8T8W5_9PEZI|nr:uncharacterized protein CLUP02_16487 [Colletotrichum lupini]UQC90955.1 hypothetical protein CLUP02_16487 [Colletotrichum lupini]
MSDDELYRVSVLALLAGIILLNKQGQRNAYHEYGGFCALIHAFVTIDESGNARAVLQCSKLVVSPFALMKFSENPEAPASSDTGRSFTHSHRLKNPPLGIEDFRLIPQSVEVEDGVNAPKTWRCGASATSGKISPHIRNLIGIALTHISFSPSPRVGCEHTEISPRSHKKLDQEGRESSR